MWGRVPVTGTATLRGSCPAAGHGLLHGDSPWGFSMGFSSGISHQHPWCSEPAFTPMLHSFLTLFSATPEFLCCCNWGGAGNFSFHHLVIIFFPFPDSCCGSRCVVQLGFRIRDSSWNEELNPCCLLLSFLTESVHASPLLFWELDCEKCAALQFRGIRGLFFHCQCHFHFPAQIFGNAGVGRPWMLTLPHLALLAYLWQHQRVQHSFGLDSWSYQY